MTWWVVAPNANECYFYRSPSDEMIAELIFARKVLFWPPISHKNTHHSHLAQTFAGAAGQSHIGMTTVCRQRIPTRQGERGQKVREKSRAGECRPGLRQLVLLQLAGQRGPMDFEQPCRLPLVEVGEVHGLDDRPMLDLLQT
jgi:hypothetical protein